MKIFNNKNSILNIIQQPVTMPFPCKGENHENGVKNEKDIVILLNNDPNNDITKHLSEKCSSPVVSFNHEGGTKQKMDASCLHENGITTGLSIKNHKKGTFDYHNTSKGVSQELKSEIEDFKKHNLDTPIPKKGGIRNDLNNIFSNYLDKLTSEEISKLLSNLVGLEKNTEHIIVNDQKTKQLIMFHESNLDKYCKLDPDDTYILKKSRAKTSRQIWIKKADGSEINTNLRIRLLLNNGITALLGKSDKNKTSIPCLKIQQDKVDTFIKECTGKVIVKY